MNYSEIITALGSSMDALSDSDLRSINNMIVTEINDRIAQKRLTIKRALSKGAQVTINDPRCVGKTYTIEKISSKTAVLVENGSEYVHPVFGNPIAKRIRASITMLQTA
jgi:hypothetical protein